MKKTLIALSLLSAFGVAQAENSVTLYGNLNVAVTKKGDAGVTLKSQEYRYASHLGFTGKEDLGNGYSAIFKLEAELEPDTGSGTYGSEKNSFGFNRHAYVGLITPFGAFRFGRSTTPLVNMWIGGGFGEGRGIGEFTGGLAGTGLRTTHPEAAPRWNNGLFYDIKKGGFTGGLAVTTKGSESIVPTSSATTSVNNEGEDGTDPAYGLYARYEGKSGMWGYKVGAAYQVENGSSYNSDTTTNPDSKKNAPAEAEKAWLLGAGVSYGPASLDVGYAEATIDNTDVANNIVLVSSRPIPTAPLRTGKSKSLFVSLGYDINARNHVYLSYGNYKRTNNFSFIPASALTGYAEIEGSQYSIGYEHKLSKRTVVYANARKVSNITNRCTTKAGSVVLTTGSATAFCASSVSTVNSILNAEKDYSYDIGISHSF